MPNAEPSNRTVWPTKEYLDEMLSLKAFTPASWRKLFSIGVPRDSESMNMLPPLPMWNPKAADAVALALVSSKRWDLIFACGLKVARGFAVTPKYGDVLTFGKTRVIVCPHPSGRNRFWNDAEQVRLFRGVIDEIIGRSTLA